MSRRVVITGASSGIGQAAARAFCAEGAAVVNLDVQPGEATRALCGEGFHTVPADTADPASIERAFTEVDRLFAGRPPEVLVCCAAVSKAQPFLEADPESFERMLAVNVRGTFLVCQQAARRMARARTGHIVVITSVAAASAWAREPVYCVTKGAQAAMVQAMAVELAPFGILVNAVGPGPVQAPPGAMAHTRADPEVLRHDLERTPLGRFGRPEEVAEAVLFLSRATWMTGQTVFLDGGFLSAGLAYFGQARAALTGGLAGPPEEDDRDPTRPGRG